MNLTPAQMQEATRQFCIDKEEELQKELGQRLVIIAQTVVKCILTERRFHIFNEAQLRYEIERGYAEKVELIACESHNYQFIRATGLIIAACNEFDSDIDVWEGRVSRPTNSIRYRPNRELQLLLDGNAPITMVSLKMIVDFQNRRKENPGTWRDPAPDQVIGTTFCDADFKPIDC